MDDIYSYLDKLQETLTENTALLARIDEQLKAFREKVGTLDSDMRDVKRHVEGVRTVSKLALAAITASAGVATVFKLFLRP